MIRVLIADDHVIVRNGLRELFQDMGGFTAARMVASSEDVLEVLRHDQFDLILLDLSMPGIGGRDLVRCIRVLNARIPILVLSMHDEPHIVKRVLQAGASGFVSKGSAEDTLMLAIRKVAAGGRFIDSSITEQLIFNLPASGASAPRDCLSPRELQVMKCLAQGRSVTEIAAELLISDKTVSTHKMRLMRKMNLRSNAELVRCAVDHGLVD